MKITTKRILIIYYNPDSIDDTRITLLHHLKALEYVKGINDIHYLNVYEIYRAFLMRGKKVGNRRPNIHQNWDAIIFHYSFLAMRTIGWHFRKLKKEFFWVGELKGLKIAIPQDEGDYAGILDEWLLELGTDIIFSVHYTTDGPLYPIMRNHAEIFQCLPGYIDEQSVAKYETKINPIANRELDIIYRVRYLPLWFGTAGRIKHQIAEHVKPKAFEKGLKTDISTKLEDTILGELWLDFMTTGKTVLGAPGGYSTIDWRGEIKAKVRSILRKNPCIDFKQLNEMMPVGWDDQRLFTVTPRHFEAIITNTCQVLIYDDYKGILIPDYHYIPIKSDWSNLDEALDRINNTQEIQKIADQARKDILYSGKFSYRAFASILENVMQDYHFTKKKATSDISKGEKIKSILKTIKRQFISQRDELYVLKDRIHQIMEKRDFKKVLGRKLIHGVTKCQPFIRKWKFYIILILLVTVWLVHLF